MSLFSITSANHVANLGFGADYPAVIDIPVAAGEFPSLKDVLLRVVQQALGGAGVDDAGRFLDQSNLLTDAQQLISRQTNPATGQNFYRFNAAPQFWQSVESFQRTGQAIPLAAPTINQPTNQPMRQPDIRPAQKTTDYRTRVGIDRRQQLQQRYNPRLPEVRQTAQTISQPLVTQEDYARLRSGADGKTYLYEIATNGLKNLPDPRPEMLRRAAFQAGYDSDAVAEYVNRYPELVYKSGPHYNQVVTLADAKQLIHQPTIEIALDASARRTLTRLEIQLKGTPDAKLNLEIQDEIAKINERYEKLQADRSAKGRDNRLLDAFEDLDRQNEIKSMIDRVIDSSGRDFRADSTEAQKQANQTADTIAGTMRALIDAHPLYRFMPQAVKEQMVDFGIGIARGTISLASVPAGLQQALTDGVQDIMLGGARKLGYDTTKIEQRLGAERQRSADQWSALVNLHTPRTMRGEVAYEIKRAQNLRLTPYDAPNWAVKAGEISIKAVPYLAAGIATDGASFGVQIAATATLSGVMSGGETYAASRDRGASMQAATFAAAQGAVMPIGNRLGIGGDLALNAATAYTMAKVQGQRDDNLIFQDIFAQTAFAGAFRAGGKINEALTQKFGRSFSETEAQQTFREVVQQETHLSLRENLKAAYTEYKSRITAAAQEATTNYGAENRLATNKRVRATDEFVKSTFGQGLQVNAVLFPPQLISAAVKALYHGEASVRAFKDFAAAMRRAPEYTPQLESQMAQLYRVAVIKQGVALDEAGLAEATKNNISPIPEDLSNIRAKLTAEGKEAFDARYALIVGSSENFRGLNSFRAYLENLQRTGLMEDSLVRDYRRSVVVEASRLTLSDLDSRGVAIVAALAQQKIPEAVGIKAAKLAQDINASGIVEQLVASGKLNNPEKLADFLWNAYESLHNVGDRGLLMQLEETSIRAQAGHEVSIEQAQRPVAGKADIIDHTTLEAIQMKAVSSERFAGLMQNIADAAAQLRGQGGTKGMGNEHPPVGYKRVILIRFQHETNPLAKLTRSKMLEVLYSEMNKASAPLDLSGVDEIQIRTQSGVLIFKRGDF